MKNTKAWKPSKFKYANGRLEAHPSVSIFSRLMAGLVAEHYSVALQDYARGSLLDLGCGTVPMYLAYKDQVEEIICIDWANSEHQSIHLDSVMDLNEPLVNIPDNSFDTIILSDVLEHIRNPEQLLSEISRILKKEGVLLLNVPFFYWLHEKPYDFFRYTKFALEGMMDKVELDVLSLKTIGGSPEILADILMKHLHEIPLFGKLFCWLIHHITWGFIHTPIGKKLSTKTSKNFPFGYFLIARK